MRTDIANSYIYYARSYRNYTFTLVVSILFPLLNLLYFYFFFIATSSRLIF